MRISEYPPEELQEWLNLPATRGFVEELEYLKKDLQNDYAKCSNQSEFFKQQGKEEGVWEAINLLRSLGEGL